MVEILWKFFFPYWKILLVSPGYSLSKEIKGIQPKAVVVLHASEIQCQVFLKCHLLQSFASGILCPAKDSWNTRTHVYPGLENELVLTYMPRRKAEKDLTSWNMLEKQ